MKEDVTQKYREIRQAEQKVSVLRMELRHLQELCPHVARRKWTNNDGDGQFVVERCEDCGAQKDGGL